MLGSFFPERSSPVLDPVHAVPGKPVFEIGECRLNSQGQVRMTRRRVTHARKGPGGRILGLGGPSFGFLSAEAVAEIIRRGADTYYVREAPFESEVRVVEEGGKVVLVSTSDVISRNNLLNLPRC